MKAVGIILAGGGSDLMKGLVDIRAVAAMPVAGAYRAVDFALSNMANSKINTVAVLTQYSSRSLNEHLSAPSWWGFGRKQGGLFLLNPTITPESTNWFRGTADALVQNLDFIKERHEPYVVIASGDGVYKLDFDDVMAKHVESGAQITVVCREKGDADSSRFGVLETDGEGRITAWHEKEEGAEGQYINCGIYLIRRLRLIRLLEECKRLDQYDFVHDVLQKNLETERIKAYVMDGYWKNIASAQSYFECNMDMLSPELRKRFFYEYPPISTKVDDFPPAKFNDNARVVNSLAAGGTIVNGTVENSVLFKKVYIGDGSVVRNCVLLNDVYVGNGVTLENCIVEKKVKIEDGTTVIGDPNDVTVLP